MWFHSEVSTRLDFPCIFLVLFCFGFWQIIRFWIQRENESYATFFNSKRERVVGYIFCKLELEDFRGSWNSSFVCMIRIHFLGSEIFLLEADISKFARSYPIKDSYNQAASADNTVKIRKIFICVEYLKSGHIQDGSGLAEKFK